MSEVSSGRRRLGILAITTTALALPLTASISYAQGEPPLPPELLRCVRWLGDTLVNESYMPEAANAAAQGWR